MPDGPDWFGGGSENSYGGKAGPLNGPDNGMAALCAAVPWMDRPFHADTNVRFDSDPFPGVRALHIALTVEMASKGKGSGQNQRKYSDHWPMEKAMALELSISWTTAKDEFEGWYFVKHL
jgi:hypothetical protein